jgi:Holliday junction resolvase RusA-like endonuclease
LLSAQGRAEGNDGKALYLEFIVPGPPISNQQSTAQGKANLATWKATIAGAATLNWPNPPLTIELKAVIINFYDGNDPSLDLDNMSKPILDAMEQIVYNKDRQVVQSELTHARIGAPYPMVGVRPMIVMAVQAGNQFVYVRIEDPVTPFPLPK